TYVFLFSSRRRHTSSKRDWSSDVCSSDLALRVCVRLGLLRLRIVSLGPLGGRRRLLIGRLPLVRLPVRGRLRGALALVLDLRGGLFLGCGRRVVVATEELHQADADRQNDRREQHHRDGAVRGAAGLVGAVAAVKGVGV